MACRSTCGSPDATSQSVLFSDRLILGRPRLEYELLEEHQRSWARICSISRLSSDEIFTS